MRDNLVLADQATVVKVARPGGEDRVANGLRMAVRLAGAGVPVVHPLSDQVHPTELGVASYWPRVTHHPLDAETMTRELAHKLGKALGVIAQVNRPAALTWNPFARLHARVAVGAAWATPLELSRLVALADEARAWVGATGADKVGTLAHGDVSLTNALHTPDGIRLIDFDSAGLAPRGWDLACLLLRLTLEASNDDAAAGVHAGWGQSRPAPEALDALMGVKLVMGTSFLLTLGHDQQARAVFTQRLNEVEVAVSARRLPGHVTPMG